MDLGVTWSAPACLCKNCELIGNHGRPKAKAASDKRVFALEPFQLGEPWHIPLFSGSLASIRASRCRTSTAFLLIANSICNHASEQVVRLPRIHAESPVAAGAPRCGAVPSASDPGLTRVLPAELGIVRAASKLVVVRKHKHVLVPWVYRRWCA
jgi:hypothetical protein